MTPKPLYKQIAYRLNARKNAGEMGNSTWQEKHSTALEEFNKLLPSASGFDSGCTIDLDNSSDNRIVINADYHHMDSNGYYCGWIEYRVIVKPSLMNDFTLDIKGRDYNGFKEYAYELFYDILNQLVD